MAKSATISVIVVEILTTTYHIQGAGAPAKTKNYVNADGVYIFSGKGPTFSASCKTSEHFSLHACMGIRNVNAKHTEYEVRGEKAINNRIETESEEKTMGLIKENGQKFIMIGGYVYVRWKKKVPFRFEGA